MRLQLDQLWEQQGLAAGAYAAAWSPGCGRLAVLSGESLLVYEAGDGGPRLLLEARPRLGKLHGLAWSPNGRYIALAGGVAVLAVVDAETGEIIYHDKGLGLAVQWAGDRIAAGGLGYLAFYRWHSRGAEKEWEKTIEGVSIEGGGRAWFFTASAVELAVDTVLAAGWYSERGKLRAVLVAVPAGGEPRLYGPGDLGLPVHRDTMATWIKASRGGVAAVSTHEQSRGQAGRILVLRATSAGGVGRVAEHTARGPLYSLTWALGSVVLAGGSQRIEAFRLELELNRLRRADVRLQGKPLSGPVRSLDYCSKADTLAAVVARRLRLYRLEVLEEDPLPWLAQRYMGSPGQG